MYGSAVDMTLPRLTTSKNIDKIHMNYLFFSRCGENESPWNWWEIIQLDAETDLVNNGDVMIPSESMVLLNLILTHYW